MQKFSYYSENVFEASWKSSFLMSLSHRLQNRGEGVGASGPSTFQMGGMAPPLFWPSCSEVKDTPVDMLLNVLHDEK